VGERPTQDSELNPGLMLVDLPWWLRQFWGGEPIFGVGGAGNLETLVEGTVWHAEVGWLRQPFPARRLSGRFMPSEAQSYYSSPGAAPYLSSPPWPGRGCPARERLVGLPGDSGSNGMRRIQQGAGRSERGVQTVAGTKKF
jgi:hypothetical protein